MEILNLKGQIVRFVDERQPGWVEFEFEDAEGRRHMFVDKVPILTSKDLRADSAYPQLGLMPCEVLTRWRGQDGRELVRISTANPLDDKSAEGLTEFVVEAAKLSAGKAPVRR
jgi:hypothetical protein